MERTDALYEIAATDAWRALLARLDQYQRRFEEEVITVSKRLDFSPTEVARCSGRVEAVEAIKQALKEIGAQDAP